MIIRMFLLLILVTLFLLFLLPTELPNCLTKKVTLIVEKRNLPDTEKAAALSYFANYKIGLP